MNKSNETKNSLLINIPLYILAGAWFVFIIAVVWHEQEVLRLSVNSIIQITTILIQVILGMEARNDVFIVALSQKISYGFTFGFLGAAILALCLIAIVFFVNMFSYDDKDSFLIGILKFIWKIGTFLGIMYLTTIIFESLPDIPNLSDSFRQFGFLLGCPFGFIGIFLLLSLLSPYDKKSRSKFVILLGSTIAIFLAWCFSVFITLLDLIL